MSCFVSSDVHSRLFAAITSSKEEDMIALSCFVSSDVHSRLFAAVTSSKSESESESESALFAKCVQTHEEFVVVFKKLLVHTCIHTYIYTYIHINIHI